MDVSLNNIVLAVFVTKDKADKVTGGVPIFIVEDGAELEEKSSIFSRITMSMVHELEEGFRIIVKH